MVDMCACSNYECPKRGTCYRFLIDATKFGQTYSKFDEKDCERYIEVKGKEVD